MVVMMYRDLGRDCRVVDDIDRCSVIVVVIYL